MVFELPDEKEAAGYSKATKALMDGRQLKGLDAGGLGTEKGMREPLKAAEKNGGLAGGRTFKVKTPDAGKCKTFTSGVFYVWLPL